MKHIIEWAGNSTSVDTLSELDQLLDKIAEEAARRPLIARIIGPRGDYLMIGIGQPDSFLSFELASGDSPYLVSVGEETAQGVVEFTYENELTEIPKRYCIQLDLARRGVRDFFRDGNPSDEINWDKV